MTKSLFYVFIKENITTQIIVTPRTEHYIGVIQHIVGGRD